jgi:ribonuclease R
MKGSSLPTPDQILEFIRANGGTTAKRDIARAFGVKGSSRIGLKRLLKQMADDGLLGRNARKVHDAGQVPDVIALEVIGTDRDGELFAEPVTWEDAKKPRVLIVSVDGPPPAIGARMLAKIEPQRDRHYPYRARVIKQLGRAGNRVLGVFRATRGHGTRIVPVDKKAKREIDVVTGGDAGARDGELVEAEIVQDRGRGHVSARVTERLGDIGDQRNVSLIAIRQHGIPDVFPEKVFAEADSLTPVSAAGRLDLRDMPLITIDPPDARDHDDAVWAAPDDAHPGGVQIAVAIADVAAYVRTGTGLDREARQRGNSVYFPDRVVPMLPERLSNDLCSLREKQDRPALVCFMAFNAQGKKTSHRFARVTMRSAAKLSYQQAQAAIDGRPDAKTEGLLEPCLKPLWAAYRVLMRGRMKRGPLELELPERKLIIDAHGLVERVVTPEHLDAHRLVEEFMIQANVSAAEELEARKSPVIYRIHEPPDPKKIAALADFLRTIDIPLAKAGALSPSHFNDILRRVEGKDYQHLVNEMVLRSQSQALYAPQNKGHFGLHLKRYAHFTSPIRRYADLIVHRSLVSGLGLGEDGLGGEDVTRLADTCELISGAERRAMAAERETIDRLIAKHLSSQVGAIFAARIGGVVGAGLFVKLDDSGADGFVPVRTLGSEYFTFDEKRHILKGGSSGETYRLGDPVQVRLVEAAPISGGLKFEMVSASQVARPAFGKARRRQKR